MRHKLTFALASAALACSSIWGCSDDDVSPGIGGAGGSAGAGGRGGRGGTGGTPGTGGTGTATGGTSAATGGSGGTGTGTGGSGGTGTVGDSGVEPDATVDEGDASVEPDSGSPGPDGDAGLPGTDAGLASTNAFLCTENCNTQQTVCGTEFQFDVCNADCNNRVDFAATFECVQAAVALQQCLSRAPNTWTCQPDAGTTVSSTPTGCAAEIAASNSACAAP